MRLRWVSPRRWRLSSSLTLTIVLLAALLVLVSVLVERALIAERLEAELDNAVSVGMIAAAEVDRFLRNIESTTLAVTQFLAVEPFNQKSYDTYLGRVYAATGVLRSLLVTDLDGTVIAAAFGEGIGTDLSTRPYVHALQAGAATVWSEGLPTGPGRQIMVAYGRVITTPGGTRRGFLIAAFQPPALMSALTESLPQDARVTLLDQRGFVIYTSAGILLTPAERDLSPRPNIQRALRGEVVRLSGRAAPLTEDPRYGALVPIARTGWVLAFSRELIPLENRLRAPFGRQRRLLVGAIIVAGAIGFGVSLRLFRPLGRLAQAAAAIARGERPTIPDVAGPAELAALVGGMSAMSRAVQEREEALRLIAEAGKQLSATLELDTIVRDLARLVVPRLADWCLIYLLGPDDSMRRVETAHVDAAKEELVRRFAATSPGPDAAPALREVLATGRSMLLPDVSDDLLRRLSAGEDQVRLSREIGITSAMHVPMLAHGKAMGALSLISSVSARRYTADDLALAEELAQRAALAADKARAYERERSIAETLQRSLLRSRLPQLPGITLASRYLPARLESEVGGDWYDAVVLPDGGLAVVMGDVAGRGIQAAAVMGQLQNAVRAYAAEGYGPAVILQRVARMLDLREMATLLILVFDPATHAVRYANAGHLPPLVLAPDGTVTVLEGGSAPLSIVSSEVTYVDYSAHLIPGSTVLLYTDGLVEVRGESIDEGLVRLTDTLRRAPAEDVEGLVNHVLFGVLREEAGTDDVALLAMHAAVLDPALLRLRLDASPDSAPLLRHTLRRWLAQSHLEAAEIFDLTVAASEAFSNAIEHAYGAGDATIDVDARVDGDVVRVTVRDWGRWREQRGQHRGRGIALMRGLMDEVDVASGPEGTTVRMWRRVRREVTV
jgi:serine phosphatase RsbU (regulator of sigma subunit)/anti-sigma regulatory factor (Ser/Thr protein kinase)